MFKPATKFRPDPVAFDAASRAGFRGVEFWLDSSVLGDWRRVLDKARGYPFYYALHFPNQLELSRESIQQTVTLYCELECKSLVIHQPQFNACSEALLALEPSLAIAIENHLLDQARFERWAETSPGLALDVEHLWKYTLNDAPRDVLLATLDDFLDRFVDKLQHVHLPGYRPGGPEHQPWHSHPEFVASAFALLAKHGFDKLVVSEAHEMLQSPEDLDRDMQVFKAWRGTYAIDGVTHSTRPSTLAPGADPLPYDPHALRDSGSAALDSEG
jgi:sugar phosphate isomerase/epimerase